MPRKSIEELKLLVLANLPDNVTSLITPAKLREVINEFLSTMSPAYGYLTIGSTPVNSMIGTTPALTNSWQTATDSDPSQTTAALANGSVTRIEKGVVRITLQADIGIATNRLAIFTLVKDGVATPWNFQVTGTGTGDVSTLNLVAIVPSDTPGAVFQVYVNADANGTQIAISNAIFAVELIPSRVFT